MRRHSWTAMLALALAASCGEPTGPMQSEASIALEHAIGRWAVNAPAAYEVTVRLSCFCDQGALRPVVVRVRGGTVESRRYADDGTIVPANRASSYPSVTSVFAFIADADAQHAARINASYDATFGFPASVFVDYAELIADEEMGYLLTDFHAVP